MASTELFWLGPLGRLVPLAIPEGEVDRSPVRTDAAVTSLNGRVTTNARGYRSSWQIPAAYLLPEDAGYIEAAYQGLVGGPLRLLDPSRDNRMRPSVAAPRVTAAFADSDDAWSTTAGVVFDEMIPSLPVEYTVDFRSVSYELDRRVVWNVGNGSTMELRPNGALRTDGTARPFRVDPVLPGEQITVAFQAHVSGTGTATLFLDSVAADMTVTPGVASVAVANTAPAWKAITWTATAGSVGVFPRFTATADTVDVHIGMGYLRNGVAGSWSPGYGAPEVGFTSLSMSNPERGVTAATLALQEL